MGGCRIRRKEILDYSHFSLLRKVSFVSYQWHQLPLVSASLGVPSSYQAQLLQFQLPQLNYLDTKSDILG